MTLVWGVAVLALSWTTTALAAQTNNPTFVIDGRLDEPIWQNLPVEKLTPDEDGIPAGIGGEIRTVVVGRYLYVGARLPEPTGRITARLIGRNPSWEDEDLLRILCGPDIGYTDRILQINPWGAYSIEKALHVTSSYLDVYPYSLEKPTSQVLYKNASKFLVGTSIGEHQWTAEAAIPLNELSAPGSDRIMVRIERVRAARPGSPQQRWHWPERGPAAKVPALPSKWDDLAPVFQPPLIGNSEPPLKAGRTTTLPAMESTWDDSAWRNVPIWMLLRNEPAPRSPRFPTEIKVVQDGRWLAVFARCVEPSDPLARVRENDGRVNRDGTFQVYLATSGSSYAGFVVNETGYLLDNTGFFGGERLSRAREWNSGARVLARGEEGAWTVRIDIPLEPVAKILGEDGVPAEWRVLFRRVRQGRNDEPEEESALPVTDSDTPLCTPRYRRFEFVEADPSTLASLPPPPVPSGLAALDTRVLLLEERKKLAIAQMLNHQLAEQYHRNADAVRSQFEHLSTRSDWERFRDVRIGTLRASMGKFPARTPLQTRVTKEFEGDGYRRQDLIYQSWPGMWVTANLYLPLRSPAQMPGIIIVHSHHRPRTQAELQDMGILWARAGCAVLIMDQIGHGERIQNYPWNREPYHSRYIMGMQLYLAGESLLKWMVWDVMRGIDLLIERKDVNPDQIILLGAVAAGGEPAAVTAALDKRVAAVVPFNFGVAEPEWGEWESTRCLRRSLIDQFFPWIISASIAPRYMVYANEMGWEHYKDNPAWAYDQKVFALYGVAGNLDEAHGFGDFPGPGECSNIGPGQRQTLYPALKRWFGIPIPATEPNDRRPEAELASLTPAIAQELKMAPLHELAGKVAFSKLDAARTEMEKLDARERRLDLQRRLAAKLGDIEPNPKPEAAIHWTKLSAGTNINAVTLKVEPGIIVPLLVLRPTKAPDRSLPVVVAVSEGGKDRFLAERSDEIEALLKAGVAVCLPDVRGTGETTSEMHRGLNSEEESAAATEFMLGNTLLGARLKDLRSVLAYLSSRSDMDNHKIGLWGDSFTPVNPPRFALDELIGWQIGPDIEYQAEPLGGLLALLGGLYENNVRAVATRRGLVSYSSILEDQFAYVPNDIIVPGILEVGDVADIAAALAPRPLLIENSVDGRNRVVKDASLRDRLALVFQSYSESPTHLRIRSEPRDPNLVRWLAQQLGSSAEPALR
jgi:cephalosporin-C deacetylase-like acetyl esterase